MPKRRQVDRDAVTELGLYIGNDGQLYESGTRMVEKNLARKMARGKYDPRKAPKAFSYTILRGAKKYAKEFGSSEAEFKTMFPKKVRDELARQAARSFEVEHRIRNKK